MSIDAPRTAHPDNLEIAEAIAPGWGRRRAFIEEVTTPVRRWLVRELQPQPGARVVELAAGAGDTGFDAAALLGERGRLISSDLAPAMLELARRRGRERGVDNVDYRVLDAERIELPSDSVDGVLCRFGYMLMADPAAALAETRRVLRPGGRVSLAVWGAPDRNPFFGVIGTAMVEAGQMPPPDPCGPGAFSMASAEGTRALLAGAGFADVRTEPVAVRFSFVDVGEYVAIAADTAGPMALALRALGDAEREALTARLEDPLAPFAADAGYELPGVALCAVGR